MSSSTSNLDISSPTGMRAPYVCEFIAGDLNSQTTPTSESFAYIRSPFFRCMRRPPPHTSPFEVARWVSRQGYPREMGGGTNNVQIGSFHLESGGKIIDKLCEGFM